MKRFTLTSAALLIALAGCSDSGTSPANGEVIMLTASQAAALVSRVESFGTSDPSLVSLSDTVDLVIKAGTQARRIEVTTDLGANVFYAVSLHMPNTMSSPASSTFHVIAFDDPSNPTRFIILGGWASGSGTSAPTSVTGPIGGQATTSLTAHLFSVSGSQLSAWHASTGSSTLAATATQQTCTGFTGPGTCVGSNMDVTFNITGTVAGNGTTGQRTASGTVTAIPGIRLSM